MTIPKRFAQYVGFTKEEVEGLCKKYGMSFSEAERWYDGYSFRKLQHVYIPNEEVREAFGSAVKGMGWKPQ